MNSQSSRARLTARPQSRAEALRLDARLESARRWLARSGIQDHGAGSQQQGGFHAWYDLESGSYPYLYAEITGYLVTALSIRGEALELAAACRAAEWLVGEMLVPDGGFRCLEPVASDRFSHKRRLQYTFDNGIIIQGLARLYRRTGERTYLDAATAVARWLVDLQHADGGFPAAVDAATGEVLHCEDGWSTQPGPHQAKIAIGLHAVGEMAQDETLCTAAVRACEFALGFEDASGRFLTMKGQNCTNAHPHAYAAEALWALGLSTGRGDFLRASARATRWLLENISNKGEVPRLCHDGGLVYHERVDVIAQTLRLTVLHLAGDRLPRRLAPVADRLAEKLLVHQSHEPDLRAYGGFHFGKLSDGLAVANVNTWVTAFSIQALGLYRDYVEGSAVLSPHDLI